MTTSTNVSRLKKDVSSVRVLVSKFLNVWFSHKFIFSWHRYFGTAMIPLWKNDVGSMEALLSSLQKEALESVRLFIFVCLQYVYIFKH